MTTHLEVIDEHMTVTGSHGKHQRSRGRPAHREQVARAGLHQQQGSRLQEKMFHDNFIPQILHLTASSLMTEMESRFYYPGSQLSEWVYEHTHTHTYTYTYTHTCKCTHTHMPYSAKFSRRIIFVVFADWPQTAKIKLANCFVVYACIQSILGP